MAALDPKSALELGKILAEFGTSIAEFIKVIGEGRFRNRNDAHERLSELIEMQHRIEEAHRQAVDDHSQAVDAITSAIRKLASAMDKRTKLFAEFITKIDASDIGDKDELSQLIQDEIDVLKRQRRSLDRQQSKLNHKTETLQKQTDEIMRLNGQLQALTTLIDIRFGGR